MTTHHVFKHTSLLDGLGKTKDIDTFQEDELHLVRSEADRSSIVYSAIQFLIVQVTSKGYTIEYSEAGQTRKVSDVFVNTVLNTKWDPEIPKAIYRSVVEGGYAIRYTKTGDKEHDFVYPRVMDPSEYYIGWKTKRDGQRKYFAYDPLETKKAKIIPQTRVFMIFEPTGNGRLTSPISRCLEELKLWRFYWEIDQAAAYRNAFPGFFYIPKETKEQLLPETNQAGTLAEYEGEIRDAPTVSFNQLQRIQAHDKSIEHMRKMLERETSRATINQHFGSVAKLDPNSNTFYEVANQYPFAPYQQVPPGLTTAEAPRSREPSNIKQAIDTALQLISGAIGIPSDVLFDTGKKFSTDLRIAQRTVNETVKHWQKSLEQHIVTMYLDIYYKKYADRLDRAFASIVSDRKKRFLQSAESKKSPLPQLLDPDERVRIEQSMSVTVTFTNNPIVATSDLNLLYDRDVISKESYNRHMLEIIGFSEAEALTPAQELAQIKEKARKAELAAPKAEKPAKRQKVEKPAKAEETVDQQLQQTQI